MFFTKMTQIGDKPLLLVDIDGVLSVWGFPVEAPPRGVWSMVDGIPHFLSAAVAERLRGLEERFELVWCSGWEEKANDYLPHAVGIGPLPHVSLDTASGERTDHWKLDGIDAHAPRRPLAWVDDAHDESCHAWAARRGAPTLLVTTDPATGLTEAHVAELTAWARAQAVSAGTR